MNKHAASAKEDCLSIIMTMDDDSELKMKNEERENFKEGNKMFRSEAGNKKEEFEDV